MFRFLLSGKEFWLKSAYNVTRLALYTRTMKNNYATQYNTINSNNHSDRVIE